MAEFFDKFEKKTRDYIGAIVVDVKPKHVDAVFNSIQENCVAGAKFLLDGLIERTEKEELNHWEMKLLLEEIRHDIAMYVKSKEQK